ncbi:hypothetical protein Fmac_015939 [Flemingia macrophylla]|uniref:Leucine-rich repeat-containing N-terminal plant-type domain-containing protein n=1 Tax=Flemingia macrophylla TaxID=520843 RepID=A0ABD1MG43_9FABA
MGVNNMNHLQAKPFAAKWRVNLIRYYDLMEELWGADCATGHMARTACQARRNISTQSLKVDLNDDVDYILEEQSFDPGFDTTYRSPPHMDSYSPSDSTQSVSSATSGGTGGTSSSQGTKRKSPMVDVMDAHFDKLTTKLDVFTDYLGQGNALTQKLFDIGERQVLAIERRNEIINKQVNVMRQTSTFQHSESDIWDMYGLRFNTYKKNNFEGEKRKTSCHLRGRRSSEATINRRCIKSDTGTLCIPSERETLLKLKRDLSDPSNRLSSWNNASENSNCCEWVGVVCNNVTAHVAELHLNTAPYISDDYLFDEGLFDEYFEAFRRSELGGKINPCLADLKHLNYLDLSWNLFRGQGMPVFLWTMTSLTHMDLSYSGFYGKIPPQIGNLSNLVYLDLRQAAYGSIIPSQIGNLSDLRHLTLEGRGSGFAENVDWLPRLSKLEYLFLEGATLSEAWIHAFHALPSLTNLNLIDCLLPLCYSQPSLLNFSSLLTLDVSFANYSFVPKWIFGLTKLVSLRLIDNNIQGPILDDIQNLTLLQNLDLSENSFTSSIPVFLGNLTSLVELDLSGNQLEGAIPTFLGNLTLLVELDLSYNQLEGKIPTSLNNLCNLRKINFSYLKLNQQINEILQILSNGLIILLVRSSQVSGNLTNQIGDFNNIVALDFSNNSIDGSLPKSFKKLSSLKYLNLSNNQFSGNPFDSLRSLSSLSHLSIDDNHFQGVVKEDDFASFTSLTEFYAGGNNFTLKVGHNWHLSSKLTWLDMKEWQLGPNFPSWIQSQNKLKYLEMSNAGIFDSIPIWFWETSSDAYFVNLSHNHIHGELGTTLRHPISIMNVHLSKNHLRGKLPHLSENVVWLDLSSNSFSGSMNDFLCKNQDMNHLNVLNLASNNLSGEIPDCWMKWLCLVDINLQSNHFFGKIPPSMGFLFELQSLQVRNNSLSGIFSTSFKNNRELMFLDFGENNLSGTIPLWVGERFIKLRILCLRSNNFSGHIPNKICDMSHLQVLDLAHNNLSGNIPNCLNHLNAMTLMNRSTTLIIYTSSYPSRTKYLDSELASALLWLKGRVDEYKTILGLVTNIDLSNNKLSGEIPTGITNLNGLIFLNLSHNQLTGHIPYSIGDMRSLTSIDFSRNQLFGEIPPTISKLSFLNMLDLSNNHLKGKIPTGTQLQTFDASSFVGNNLCGPPLTVNCSSNGKIRSYYHKHKGSHRQNVKWFFVSMTFGFIVGFWIVVGPLFICRSWRYAYYDFLDERKTRKREIRRYDVIVRSGLD